MSRKLASIQIIEKITPIEGADNIVKATMEDLGWECIINKKENHKVGDKVVFFEIDSILPQEKIFDFMGKVKYRVKTIKLRGQISQGLIMSTSVFDSKLKLESLKKDTDITEILNVKKFIPGGPNKEKKLVIPKNISWWKKYLLRFSFFRKIFKQDITFPKFLKKTDETRIQRAMNHLFNPHLYSATEKLDGQSATFAIINHMFKDEYIVCSRNIRLYDKKNNYYKMLEKYDIKTKLKLLSEKYGNVCIQGEIIGPNIQGNKYGLDEHRFYMFNCYSFHLNEERDLHHFTTSQLQDISKKHNIPMVPIRLASLPIKDMNCDELVKLSEKPSIIPNDQGKRMLKQIEGLVWRQDIDPTQSFKVINPKFNIKFDE